MTIYEMPDCAEKMCEVALKDGTVLVGMTYSYGDEEAEPYIEVEGEEVYLTEVEKITIVEKV